TAEPPAEISPALQVATLMLLSVRPTNVLVLPLNDRPPPSNVVPEPLIVPPLHVNNPFFVVRKLPVPVNAPAESVVAASMLVDPLNTPVPPEMTRLMVPPLLPV